MEDELEFIGETREQCHEEGTVSEAPRLGKGPCLAAVADGRKLSRQPGQVTMLGQESQSCVEHRSSIPGVGLDWRQPSLGQEPQDDVFIGPLLSRSQSPDLCNEMIAHRGFCDAFQTFALQDNLIRPPPSPPPSTWVLPVAGGLCREEPHGQEVSLCARKRAARS